MAYPTTAGTPTTLVGEVFDTLTQTITEDYAVDQANRLVILRLQPKDITLLSTNGGKLQVNQFVDYPYGESTNAGVATEFQSAMGGAGDGIVHFLIQDNTITETALAQVKADSVQANKTRTQYNLTFETNDLTWKVGQIVRLIDSDVGVSEYLTVQQINWKFEGIDDSSSTETWTGSVSCATLQLENLGTIIGRTLGKVARPFKKPPVRFEPA
jgi:hypothetical protein